MKRTFFVFIFAHILFGVHGITTPYMITSRTHCENKVTAPYYTRSYTTGASTSVRLVNGPNRYSGRVEVYYAGVWSTICDDRFDDSDARVICRMLGMNYGYARAYQSAHYGQGSGCIALDELNCHGNEIDVGQCQSYGWFRHNCGHNEDAGVNCNPYFTSVTTSTRSLPETSSASTPIRLVNGPSRYSGRVEVYHNGQWGTICDRYFDRFDARVICRMLGLYRGDSYSKAYLGAHFGQGQGNIWLADLSCLGYEYDLTSCRFYSWGGHSYCGHYRDAGVDCNAYPYSDVTLPWYFQYTTDSDVTTVDSLTTQGASTPIRLVNGPTRYSGRVEVYHNGQWGTICDSSFDRYDARVICRMLGLYRGDSYSKAYRGAHFGQGQGIIWLGDLSCSGYEYDLTRCRFYRGWGGYSYCGHYRDAGVDCNAYPYGEVTLPWYFQYTTDSLTTQAGPRLEDSIRVNCNENGWDIRIDMQILRQVYPGSKASDIYLGENTCNGIDSWNTVTFRQGLRECLTSETVRNNALVYNNELVYAEHDPVHSFIIRHYNWTIGVECDVQRNETSAGHLHHDQSNSNSHQVTGTSHYSVNMTFFKDPNFYHQIQGNPLHVTVGSDVYVKVFTQTSDWTIKMRVHTCYTKPTPYSPDSMKYYIIKNGCEVDRNTHIISQSSHETRLVFQDFEYTTNHEGIYVYCDAIFCGSSDYTNQCLQTCHPIVKRSVT